MQNLVKLLGLFLITFCWNSALQSQWSAATLDAPTYRNGNVGIGVVAPQATLHLGIIRSGDIAIYDPTSHPLTSPTSYPHIRLNTFIQKNGAITNTTVWDIDAPGSLDFRASLSADQPPSLAMSISKYGGLTVYGNRFTLGNGDMNLNSGVGTSSFGVPSRHIGFGVEQTITGSAGTYFSFAGGSSTGGAVIQGDANGNLLFLNKPADDGESVIKHYQNMNYTSMIIKADGKILIGTNDSPSFQGSNTPYKLYINGGAMAKEFVARVGWGDYVFEKDYNLLPLEKVEKHIEENGHLHNTPPAQEIEENGLPLGDMMVNQQVKIEEIFLHLIEMNKKLETLEKENQALKEDLENLKNK